MDLHANKGMNRALLAAVMFVGAAFCLYNSKHNPWISVQLWIWLFIGSMYAAVFLMAWTLGRGTSKERWIALLDAVVDVGSSHILAIALQPQSKFRRYS